MRIACIGAGPAGLYFAIAMKRHDPGHEVTVHERNRSGDTFGWGVVFSDQAFASLERADPETAARIEAELERWDEIEVHYRGEVLRSGGHGFAGIERRRLLAVLERRARELGVELRYEQPVEDFETLLDRDLVVAADGIHSAVRARWAEHFAAELEERANRYIWLGTPRPFPAFTFLFEETEHGWVWAHAYRFAPGRSTFIVECQEATWRGLGLDRASTAESIAACQRIFARHLEGAPLLDNPGHRRGSQWLRFPRVHCARWHHRNVVLIGDAAHTAHFSIGSGTRLALEDAIFLAAALHEHDPPRLAPAFDAYQDARRLEVLRLQSAARNSTEWFEHMPRYARLEAPQFYYSLLTRSQRVSHESLRARDRAWLAGYEAWLARRAGAGGQARPPMFLPLRVRGLELANRVVVSPMATYSARDGTPGDFHLVHYGARAQGGAGLVMTEMTHVEAAGRITPGCTGMYAPEHLAGWARICAFVHRHSGARIGLQLGHAGPKGATRIGWEGMDEPLEEDGWELIGPSAQPWTPRHRVPRAMDGADFERITAAFVRATGMAAEAGFDLLELHCAHGYLLSAFITPLLNRRTDRYGGSLAGRLRFPLEVCEAVRAAWPAERPLAVRISATDWVAGGVTPAESVAVARAFAAAGADLIDCSAGQTSPAAEPIYGRMFQTPLADRIRHEAGVATMAVGNIYEPDHVNGIIAAGRADLCCLARPHLADPYWTLHAAALQGHAEQPWPPPYLAGREQFERNLAREQEMAIRV